MALLTFSSIYGSDDYHINPRYVAMVTNGSHELPNKKPVRVVFIRMSCGKEIMLRDDDGSVIHHLRSARRDL